MSSAVFGPRYGSPDEIAVLTGLSVKTIRRLYRSGQLVAHKINRRVLIRIEDVEALVRRSIRETIHPPGTVPSSLTTVGRAYPYSAAESGARVRHALTTLDDLADDQPETQVDADQVESLDQLRRNLQANRGEA